MSTRWIRNLRNGLVTFLVFFVLVAFVVTCCFVLFLNIMQEEMTLVLTDEHLQLAAKLTFANVLLLSLIFSTVDSIRRHFTVDIPVQKILTATDQVMQGDFSVRIPEPKRPSLYGFARIIHNFNAMTAELSGTETLRTDFIANVSHELKTPLAVIRNYASMLRQPGLPEQTKEEYARAISDTARRLAQLITNILKLNKLENQQIFPAAEEFELGEQLCQCLLQFEDAWERKDLTIETELEENVRIHSDEELLSLVWNNLISNAVKFTPDGGTVSVRMETDGDFVTVSVSDTGCGMSPEVGKHIFEKFYQGDTSHATQGNGLGLALVKRVIDILSGEIRVQSVLGQGTTFTVRIRRR